MRTFLTCLGCSVVLGSAGGAFGQTPVAPAVAAPPTKNIYTFLLPSPEQRAACKMKLASCPPVQLLNAMLKPVGVLSGGVVPPLLPPGPAAADLAKSPQSPAGAAAKIQVQQGEAKARRANIRYLGTVDCRYYPEAEAALAESLRTDPSECVRYEAAVALNCGCCTKKTVEALKAAAGLTDDRKPAERSDRVRAAAACALQCCEAAHPPAAAPLPLEKPLPSGLEPAALTTVVPAAKAPPAAQPSQGPSDRRGLLPILKRTLLSAN